MKLVPHEHTQTTQKTVEFPQPKFINKVVDDRVTTQRQKPTIQVEMRRSSRDASDSIQRQRGGLQLYSREQVPQVQVQSVKQTQNPSPESSEQDRDYTVTACTRNDAIRNQTHGCGKDLR